MKNLCKVGTLFIIFLLSFNNLSFAAETQIPTFSQSYTGSSSGSYQSVVFGTNPTNDSRSYYLPDVRWVLKNTARYNVTYAQTNVVLRYRVGNGYSDSALTITVPGGTGSNTFTTLDLGRFSDQVSSGSLQLSTSYTPGQGMGGAQFDLIPYYSDVTPPTVPSIIGPNGWVRGGSFSIVGSSDSNSFTYYYSINNSPFTTYSNPVSLPEGNNILVQAYAEDIYGNRSSISSSRYYVDNTAPITPSVSTFPSNWVNYDVNMTFSMSSYPISGLSGIFVYWGNQWSVMNSLLVNKEGINTISIKSTSVVGMDSPTYTAVVKIDKTAPPKPVVSIR